MEVTDEIVNDDSNCSSKGVNETTTTSEMVLSDDEQKKSPAKRIANAVDGTLSSGDSEVTSAVSFSKDGLPCEMCNNYEAVVSKYQDNERNMKELLAASQHLAERYQTELSGERLYRNELESKMNSLCIDTEKEAKILAQGNEECNLKLKEAEEWLNNIRLEYDSKLKKLELRLKEMESSNKVLGEKYLKLLGKNRECAEELRAQAIELPQDVDQLQFLCLQLREELIETRAAREHRERELKDEIATLQMQRTEDSLEKERLQMTWTSKVSDVTEELKLAKAQINKLQDTSKMAEDLEKLVREYRVSIEDLEKQLKSLQTERNEFETSVNNYKQKCSALQQELDTSETVQKDFVKLSQDLQIQLEKIRQAEQEVRWQFDEDVHVCNQCNQSFSRNRTKSHCLHCGKIFCSNCLAFSVATGPHGRLAKVCQVCHTLLNRDAPPFFSLTKPKSS